MAARWLAPPSLVQAVAASGVAVLAFATAHEHPSRLARREQAAVVQTVAGLVLLALSLVNTTESDQHPHVVGVIIWLAACGGSNQPAGLAVRWQPKVELFTHLPATVLLVLVRPLPADAERATARFARECFSFA